MLDTILLEYPYVLFWFDFTEAGGGLLPNICTVGDDLVAIEFLLPFVQAYMGEDKYTANPEKIATAAQAAANARAIVEKNKDRSDSEKITAYKDKICELVTYNQEAIDDPSPPFGDPWQLVYER